MWAETAEIVPLVWLRGGGLATWGIPQFPSVNALRCVTASREDRIVIAFLVLHFLVFFLAFNQTNPEEDHKTLFSAIIARGPVACREASANHVITTDTPTKTRQLLQNTRHRFYWENARGPDSWGVPGSWYSHASRPLTGRRTPLAGTPTSIRSGPLPPLLKDFGKGQGVSA